MAGSQVSEIEAQLRAAIAAESFGEAGDLLDVFVTILEKEFRASAGDATALRALHGRANDFYDWAATRTNTFRACASAQAAQLRSVELYRRTESRSESSGPQA